MYARPAVVATLLVAVEATSLARGNTGAAARLLAGLALLIAAALLEREPEQRRNAELLELAVLGIVPNDLDGAFGDAWIEPAFLTRWWSLVPFACFFLRYPGAALRRRDRWLVGALALLTGPGWILVTLLWDPARAQYLEPNHWWTVGDWEPLRFRIQLWTAWGLALVLLAGAAVLLIRSRRAVGLGRFAVRWVTAAGAVLAVIVAVTIWIEWVGVRYWDLGEHDYGAWRTAAAGLATVAVLVEALRRRAAAVGVVDELLRVPSDGTGLTRVLRRAFADPALRLHEHPAEHRDPAPPGRAELPVTARDGRVLAYVDTDATALQDPAWTRTVLAAAGIVVENAELHRSVLDSLDDVRSSRARLVEASLVERRRVERDLHDGAQQ